jgi:hypothetical protein
MVFISLTRLRVRSWRFMPVFLWYALRSARQAQRSEGFLDGKLIVDAKKTFWTVTAWTAEAAMRAYRAHGAHKDAMGKLAHWCDEASVAHWQQENVSLPLPEEAFRRMLEGGRPSRVNHPSADRTNGHIAPIKVRSQTPLPSKSSRAAAAQSSL